MVYMDPSELGWRPYVKSWMQKTCTKMKDETQVWDSKKFVPTLIVVTQCAVLDEG